MRQHPPMLRACLLVAALTTAGCSVRDETVGQGHDDPRWWHATAASGNTGLMASTPPPTGTGSAIEYVDGFEAGVRRATEADLPMLLLFRAAWCRWSTEFAQAVVSDQAIVSLSRRFVCVTIDADRHPATCRQFDVSAFPTVVLLDAAREERYRATGSSAIVDLSQAMGSVLDAGPRQRRIAGAPKSPSR